MSPLFLLPKLGINHEPIHLQCLQRSYNADPIRPNTQRRFFPALVGYFRSRNARTPFLHAETALSKS